MSPKLVSSVNGYLLANRIAVIKEIDYYFANEFYFCFEFNSSKMQVMRMRIENMWRNFIAFGIVLIRGVNIVT